MLILKKKQPFQKVLDHHCYDMIKSSCELFHSVDFICCFLSDRFGGHNFVQISTKPGYLICWWHAAGSHRSLLFHLCYFFFAFMGTWQRLYVMKKQGRGQTCDLSVKEFYLTAYFISSGCARLTQPISLSKPQKRHILILVMRFDQCGWSSIFLYKLNTRFAILSVVVSVVYPKICLWLVTFFKQEGHMFKSWLDQGPFLSSWIFQWVH